MDFPKSVEGVGLVNGKFVDEDPATGRIGSLIPAAWGNAVTEEITAAIKEAGLSPNESDNAQLSKAINKVRSENTAVYDACRKFTGDA